MASVDMRGDWLTWQPTWPVEVIRPHEEYEGIQDPIAPSTHGAAVGVQQLRDPFVIEISILNLFTQVKVNWTYVERTLALYF
jgi:hypothetical protein